MEESYIEYTINVIKFQTNENRKVNAQEKKTELSKYAMVNHIKNFNNNKKYNNPLTV